MPSLPFRKLLLLLAVPFALPALADEEAVAPGWAEPWKDIWQASQKSGPLTLRTNLSGPAAPGKTELFVNVEVRSIKFPGGDPSPVSLAVVIDHSASMRGNRLLTVKSIAREVLAQLGPKDRLSLIRTSTGAETLRGMMVTDANRPKLAAFIEGIEASGESDVSAGFSAAVEELVPHLPEFEVNRVLLISDGRLTHGLNDPAGMAALAKEVRQQHHIHTGAVAIGGDANEELMLAITHEGWGLYEYLSEPGKVSRIGKRLKLEFTHRAAEQAELTLKLAPDVTLIDTLGIDGVEEGSTLRYPLHELGADDVIRFTLRLSVVAPKGVEQRALGTLELEYRDLLGEKRRTIQADLRAPVRASQEEAARAQNGEQVTQAVQALVNRTVQVATGTAQEGDLLKATAILDDAQKQVLALRPSVGPQAFIAELELLGRTRSALAPAKAAKPAKGKRR